jgi:integrase
MAINLMCPKCKKTYKVDTIKCTCGSDLKRNRKYRVRVKTKTGWRSGVANKLSEAKRLEAELYNSKQNISVILSNPNASPTISDVWQPYINWAEIHKRSWKGDYSRYHNHLKGHLAHLPMGGIKPFHIQKILNAMHSDYKPATIKQVLMLIKRIYNWSIEQGLYEGKNPCKVLKIPRFDNRVTNTLSRDEIERLLSVLDTWHNEMPVLIIKFALYSGKRKGEILKLLWTDIDMENGFMTLRNTKNGSTQSLPLNNHCLNIIQRALEIRTSTYVFPSRSGTGYYSAGIDKAWRLIRSRANLTIRFHDLRHTYASYLASSGKVDIYTLKELLGHSTIEMTQRYAHFVNGALRRAVGVADEVF